MKEKGRLEKVAEEKMKKAEKIMQENGRTSKKETKEKANRMFERKSKGTSQKAVQREEKAVEQRVEQLEVVEAPKEEGSVILTV